jgi:hypothetical protein
VVAGRTVPDEAPSGAVPPGYKAGTCDGCGATRYPVTITDEQCLYCEARSIAADQEAASRLLHVLADVTDEALTYVNPADVIECVQERARVTDRVGADTWAGLLARATRNGEARAEFEGTAPPAADTATPFVVLTAPEATALREQAFMDASSFGDPLLYDAEQNPAEMFARRDRARSAMRLLDAVGWPGTRESELDEYPLFTDRESVTATLEAVVRDAATARSTVQAELKQLTESDDPERYCYAGYSPKESADRMRASIAERERERDTAQAALDRVRAAVAPDA